MLELSVLKLMMKKENYLKYNHLVFSIKQEHELERLLTAISMYYEQYPEHEYLSTDELQAFFLLQYPSQKNNNVFENIFNKVRGLEISDSLASDFVRKLVEKNVAVEILELITPVLNGEGRDCLLQIPDMLRQFKEKVGTVEEASPYIEDNIEDLLNLIDKRSGLHWGLRTVNDNLGPMVGGTLGHVYAPVNCGKTTFVVSQIGAMARQLADEESILHVCNEEEGRRVKLRYYQYFLGLSSEEILEAIWQNGKESLDDAYRAAGGAKIRIWYDPNATIEGIRALLEKQPARLLVVDVADHVSFRGSGDMSGVAKLEELYRKLRGIAAQYKADIFSVGQASYDCDGRKVVHLGDMYNSKTGKPGALDWAIGIGATHDEAETNFRWLNFTKSKISSIQKVTNMIRIDKDRGQMYDV